MSGLVFVRDALGRPLMPTSPAYARTLLRRGKASLYPHPAFTILQLTDAILEPALRPILLAVGLHSATADLVVLIEQARTPPSSLRVIVELQKNLYGRKYSGRQKRHQQLQVSTPFGPSSTAQRIAEIIAILRQVLPISHYIFLAPPGTASTGTWWHQAVMRSIARQFPQLDHITQLSLNLGNDQGHLQGFLEAAVALLPQAHAQSPQLIACSASSAQRSYSGHRFQQFLRPQTRAYDTGMSKGDERSQEFGRLGTIRRHGRPFTGIVRTLSGSRRIVLKVPTGLSEKGIIWQYFPVPMRAPIHFWDSMPVILLPFGGMQR
jgi:hypothetical protein